MSIATTRAKRRQLMRENAKQPETLTIVPPTQWAGVVPNPARVAVFRSREFAVQVFHELPPVKCRLSINRTTLSGERWTDGISWDELQRIKAECGYADFDAVEIFPAERDVVNVANMRHLWIMREPLPFAWRKK